MQQVAETNLNLQPLTTYYVLTNENDCNYVNNIIVYDNFADVTTMFTI